MHSRGICIEHYSTNFDTLRRVEATTCISAWHNPILTWVVSVWPCGEHKQTIHRGHTVVQWGCGMLLVLDGFMWSTYPYHSWLHWHRYNHMIEATLNDMGKIDRYRTTTKHNNAQAEFFLVYCNECRYSRHSSLHDDVIERKRKPRYWPFCAGNSPVTGEFPTKRPVTRGFDVSLICAMNKRLSKQSWGW